MKLEVFFCAFWLFALAGAAQAGSENPVSALLKDGAPAGVTGGFVVPGASNFYWVVEGVEPGERSLQLEIQCGAKKGDENLQDVFLFLNDKVARFDSAGPNVAKEDGFYAVAQTPMLHVKNGDVVRLAHCGAKVGALRLSKERLAFAPQILYSNVSDWFLNDKTWQLSGCSLGKTLHLNAVNNSGRRQNVKISFRIVDYFQRQVAVETFETSIASSWSKDFEFPQGSSDQYRAYVELTDESGAKFEKALTARADCVDAFRKKLQLSGSWQFADVKDDFTLKTRTLQPEAPADAQWRTVSLPLIYKNHIAWLKKDFSIPPEFRGERYALRFSRLAMAAEISVNGRSLGRFGMDPGPRFLPLEIDVTDCVKPDGVNHVSIALAGAVVAYSEKVLKKGEKLPSSSANEDDLAWSLMAQGVGCASLEVTPKAHIGAIKIETSFREKTLKAEAEAPEGFRTEFRVLRQGEELVPPFSKEARWEKPLLWGPSEFPLLQLECKLYDKNGALADVKSERFGFREFWTDGMDLLWNGRSVKGVTRCIGVTSRVSHNRGEASTDQEELDSLRCAKKSGGRFLTHCRGDETFYDMADEEGLLSSRSSEAIPAGQMSLKLLRDENYWKAKARTDLAMVEKFRNHPSIFIWYLSNEFWAAQKNDDRAFKFLQPIVRSVKAADPTRFVECGSDLDLRGETQIVSVHYPLGSYMKELFATPPDMFYWRKLGQPFRKGEMVPDGQVKTVGNLHGDSLVEWGVKPIKANEFGWDAAYDFPYASTRLFGDATYASTANLFQLHKTLVMLETQAQRDAGLFSMTPWRDVAADDKDFANPDLLVLILQKYRSFYSGTEVFYDVDVFHDALKDETLNFHWSLVDASGKLVAGDSKKLEARHCQLFRERIKFVAGAPGRCKLSAGVDGAPERSLELEIHAKAAPVSSPNLIGSETDLEPLKDALLKKAGSGETVVLSPRDSYPSWLPVQLTKTGVPCAKNFSFRPNHPILEGLSEDDLSFWFPNHIAGTDCFDKPVGGNVKTLVEAGGPAGLCYAALVEAPYGEGCFLVSRLNLDQERNPVARKLVERMLAYKAPARGVLGVIAPDNALFVSYLRKYGVNMEKASFGKLDGFKALLVDGSLPLNEAQMAELKAFKGSVIVKNPGPSFGLATQRVAPCWNGRCLRVGFKPETAGLTSADFFYLKNNPFKDWSCLSNPSLLVESVGPGAELLEVEPLMYPVCMGKRGNMIFDVFNWTPSDPALALKGERVITTLLTNLGVKIDSKKSKLTVPAGLSFKQLDLSKFLDREFADEVEDDGKGGWSDQGPSCDMRNVSLAAGVHELGGAAYKIERPKSCLALSSKYRKGGYDEISVPVGDKFDWLFLLHSSAWTGDVVQYVVSVKYEDGSKYDIEMAGKRNIHDWSCDPAEPFLQEVDTATRCALTVPQEHFKHGSFFSTAWRNPSPDKKVVSLEIKSMKRGVPLLIAVSTGKLGVATDVPPPAERAALFAKAVEAGEAFEKDGKLKEAVDCYERALKLDPGQLRLYRAIGGCYEAQKDYAKALETYERSCKADPNQPPIWDLMKSMKEKLNR